MKAQKMRIQRAQMDGQMVRITQMKSSEDEDSDGSDGWSDGQERIAQMRSSWRCSRKGGYCCAVCDWRD